jgi:cytochrome c oxidase subunit II
MLRLPWFPFFPEQASSVASEVDALYGFLILISIVFGVGIALALAFFAIRYRRRSADDRPPEIHGSLLLELAWTIVPFLIVMVIFFWGAALFFTMERVPAGAMQVHVVGKRWMWKIQHMTGQREINELHVPVGQPVELLLTSEDVIHSFYVPAFRVKKDAVPGRYTRLWFEPTKTGRFHLFCAEYCGTKHSGMIGDIVVMEPAPFQEWLAGGPTLSPAAEGEKLFTSLACNTCHRADSGARGPNLQGLFGSTVTLADGRTLVADAEYIRESIVTPSAKIVSGYQPIMPTFQGSVSEEQILQIIEYVKTLSAPGASGPMPPVSASPILPAPQPKSSSRSVKP